MDNLVELVFPETDPEIAEVSDDQEESLSAGGDNGIKPANTDGVNPIIRNNTSVVIPPLPDKELKVGLFVRTAMERLANSGYTFTDDEIIEMCSDNWMHDVMGMTRRLPFFKVYDAKDKKGNYINGVTRFYAQPLTFGKYTVYLTKELFSEDKEPFIRWYHTLKKR